MMGNPCFKLVAGSFAAMGIVACNGGGGPAARTGCQSITGGLSTVTSTGSVANTGAAADGNAASYASATFSPASQSASVTATAQDGVVYPAGSRAGAFVTQLNQGTASTTTVTTLLDGRPVDSSSPASNASEDDFSGLIATGPFDAVRVSFTDTGDAVGSDYRVFEICSDVK